MQIRHRKVISIIDFYFNKCIDYDKQLIYIYISYLRSDCRTIGILDDV